MICEICQAQGLKSTIHLGGHMRTLMYCQPYHDEEGRFHHHDSNRTTSTGSCSNGHKCRLSVTNPCPGYLQYCNWSGKTELVWYED